jgi:hypothetical protein
VRRFAIFASVLAGAGCADNAITVSPVIDVPTNDNASALPVDEITLSIAHEHAATDIVSSTFHKGDSIQLADAPFGDDLVVHMTGRVGTSDVAYGRTCTFTVNATTAVTQPHLFFSRSVKFADMDPKPRTRTNGNAITFTDGSGVILGGVDLNDDSGIDTVERFDPRTGEMRTLGSVAPRAGSMAALLGTEAGAPKIVLVGGVDPISQAGATFIEVIDPTGPIERRIDRIDDSQMARDGLTATELSDGRVIVIGGRSPLQPVSNIVNEITSESGTAAISQLHAMLAHARWKHTATRLGDDVGAAVLVAGGLDDTSQPIAEAELYKPLSESFSGTTFPMNIPRSRHQAVRMPDGSVLIIGGLDASGNAIPTLERFTLDEGFKLVQGDLPSNAGLVDFTATTLPDGRVLIAGGRRFPAGARLDTAFIARLDPVDGSVDIVATDHLSVPRAGHQATVLCDGTVLVAGGTTDIVPVERYNPPAAGRR